jgi:hypothetical protein
MIKKIETGTAPYAGIHFLRFSERTKMWGPYAGLKNSGDMGDKTAIKNFQITHTVYRWNS